MVAGRPARIPVWQPRPTRRIVEPVPDGAVAVIDVLARLPASALAFAYAGVGEPDQSLTWMERAIEERDPIVVTGLKSAPAYDRLRSHPAYPAPLPKMNLGA
jgi:hypothetical protein